MPVAVSLIVLWTIFALLRKVVVLSDRLAAKIELNFNPELGANIRQTHFNNDLEDLVRYVSVTVTALSDEPVRDCRGHLKRVRWKELAGCDWHETGYNEQQQLEWGGAAQRFGAQTATRNGTLTLNVFRIGIRSHMFDPLIELPLIRQAGQLPRNNDVRYRFEVVVVGDNAVPAEIALDARYTGEDWLDFEVVEV